MLFITNRILNEVYITQPNRQITFDLNNNSPNNSVYFCIRNNPDDYSEIGFNNFKQSIRQSNYKQILFYIHGFNNLPEDDVFLTTALLQKYFEVSEKNFIQVIPIIWPCDNDLGVVKDYWDDQKSADMSSFSFARVLNKFINSDINSNKQCMKYMNILAHSMGCRVLRETLYCWNKYELFSGVPQLFRNIFLVAADIVNTSLEIGQSGELISDASRNVLVYHANDDMLLRTSKIVNLKNKIAAKRMGHTGPAALEKTHSNVYVIDCDNINNRYDFPMGHSYFVNSDMQSNKVLKHICNLMKTGRFSHEKNQRRLTLND